MKNFTLILALLPLLSFGQVEIQNNLVSTAGATQTNGVYVLDYSFGEVFTSTLNNSSYMLTQGFQQRWRSKTSTGSTDVDLTISILDEELGTIHVYPNPTFDFVYVELNSDEKFTIELTDMMGRKVSSIELFGMKNQIDLRAYENGTYYLHIQLSDERSIRLPIVKTN